MNMYKRELRANYKAFFLWAASMLFLIYVGMMKFAAFAETGDSANAIFEALPPPLLKILGMEPGLDLSSLGVFYSIFFLYFLLLTASHGCLLGTAIIAKEERDKTADFLLVKPIARRRAVTSKILAALTFVMLLNVFTMLASMATVASLNTDGPSLNVPILRLFAALFVVQLVFLAIGLFLGAASRNAARAAGLATTVILGTFLLKVLIDLNSDLDFLEFLTPFRYFVSLKVMFDGDMRTWVLVLSAVLVVGFVCGTYRFFDKRDIRN